MPLIKSKKLRDKRAAEQEAVKQMYKTGEYSMRELAEHFNRSLKYIFIALRPVDNPLDKRNKKGYNKTRKRKSG